MSYALRVERKYQFFQDLPEEEFRALKADILARGVMVAIETDEEGNVLDGHQRARAVLELEAEGHRVDYRVMVRPGLSEEDRWAHALSLNFQRRQLTMQERAVIAVDIRRRFAWSTTRIAGVVGVNQSTVSRWLSGVPDLPDHVEGEDGRVYRAEVWGGVSAGARDVSAALAAAGTIGGQGRTVDVRRALVLARQSRLDGGLVEVRPDEHFGTGEVELRIGPLTEALSDLPENSVDLILTDPPYPQEYIRNWWELAELAFRVLKPGKLLVAYCGHRWMREYWEALSTYLNYAWMGGLFFGQSGPSVHERKMFSGWRPILMFSKGDWEPLRWTKDAWYGEGSEKELHPWQQSLGTFLELVEAHSDPGDLVVDPFLGSGTTAVAAFRNGRRFVGCDVDAGAVAVARERLGF